MTTPNPTMSPTYSSSCQSNARHARPRTLVRVAVATPIGLVASQEAEGARVEAVVPRDVEVLLEEELHHLGGHVARHSGGVGEGQDLEARVACPRPGGQPANEPRVEWQVPILQLGAELRGPGFA